MPIFDRGENPMELLNQEELGQEKKSLEMLMVWLNDMDSPGRSQPSIIQLERLQPGIDAIKRDIEAWTNLNEEQRDFVDQLAMQYELAKRKDLDQAA